MRRLGYKCVDAPEGARPLRLQLRDLVGPSLTWALRGPLRIPLDRVPRRAIRGCPGPEQCRSGLPADRSWLGSVSCELRAIVLKILEDLDSINREKKSTLVLVHLPARDDCEGSDATDAWRAFMGAETAKRGMPFIEVS